MIKKTTCGMEFTEFPLSYIKRKKMNISLVKWTFCCGVKENAEDDGDGGEKS